MRPRKDRRKLREVAKNSDAMIVIGDKHSSNTQKLFEICKTNAKILTIYKQVTKWIMQKSGPTIT